MDTEKLLNLLGFDADKKLVILNCDDLGSTYSANEAIFEVLRKKQATSASLMVPCPWAKHAALAYRGEDIGVHLTLTSEYEGYRWGPITHASSLLDGEGKFPRTNLDVWEHADLDEVKTELRAQIERAILWGFEVTHLDSHMGTLQLKPEFFDIYLDLAVEFKLPMRLSARETQNFLGFPFRELADEQGVVSPDYLAVIFNQWGVGSRETLTMTFENLQPGVTELYFHPSKESPEIRACTKDSEPRIDDYNLLSNEQVVSRLLREAGAQAIGYRELKEAMRKELEK